MTQYLNFTSDLSIEPFWPLRASCTVTETSDPSPGGGEWYTVDTKAVSSWINQDRRDGVATLGNKRLQASVRVRANVGDLADLVVSVYESTNTLVGEIRLLADMVAGTAVVTTNTGGLLEQETTTDDSVFIVDEGSGVFRVGFSFSSTANTDRIIFKLHTTSSFDSADYSDANLIDSLGDGLEPFEYFTVAPKLTPTRYTSAFANPLNPDVYSEIPEVSDVWHDDISNITFDTTTQVLTPDELDSAIDSACLSPSQNHLIQVSSDDWTGLITTGRTDVRIDQTCDFLSAGGSLFITTLSGNKLITDQRWQVTGSIKGLALYNIKSTYFNDQYKDPDGKGDLNHTSLWVSDAQIIIDGCEFGLGDTADHDMMYSATAISLSGTDPTDSAVIRNCMFTGALNDIKSSGPIRVVTEDVYLDGQFQDSCYSRMNAGGVPSGTNSIWVKKNVTNGPVASQNLYLICCNTRETGWTLPGEVYPYEIGQKVAQPSGFRGEVVEIYEGDGVTTAPHVHNCRNVAGDGLGWEGDLVFILATPDSTHYMVNGEPLTGPTASYEPQFLVTAGAPTGMDGGLLLGFLHTDGHQFGTLSDVANTGYKIFTAGWFSVMSGPNAGAVQCFIHNINSTSTQKNYTRVAYLCGSSTRGVPINHTDTVIENVSISVAPLGTDSQRQLADPGVSFPGDSGIPQINVETKLDVGDRGDYDHIINRVISKTNTNPNEVGFDYPWLSNVTPATPYVYGDASYDSVYGKTRPRSAIDDAAYEIEPIIPYSANKDQRKAIIANWIDWYRDPIADGGFDLTVAQSGTGWAHPLNYGRDYNPGRVPIIKFSEWPHQVVQFGSTWTRPTFVATDGVDDLTSSVTVTESINTSQIGYQFVQYDVTNSDGNSVTTYSVVEVTDAPETSTGHAVRSIRILTQSEYDNIAEKDPVTMYLIL